MGLGGAPGEVRLLTCNIHRQHLDTADFAKFIATVRPDVIALQGWSDMHRAALVARGKEIAQCYSWEDNYRALREVYSQLSGNSAAPQEAA